MLSLLNLFLISNYAPRMHANPGRCYQCPREKDNKWYIKDRDSFINEETKHLNYNILNYSF